MIKAKIVIEIAGRPEKHIADTMKLLTERFAESNKHVKILNQKVHETQKIDMQGSSLDFYSSFVEYELGLNALEELIDIMFQWMPSHVEIIEPKEFKFSADEAGDILTDLAAKLHEQGALIKKLDAENEILRKKVKSEPKLEVSQREVDIGEGVTDIT